MGDSSNKRTLVIAAAAGAALVAGLGMAWYLSQPTPETADVDVGEEVEAEALPKPRAGAAVLDAASPAKSPVVSSSAVTPAATAAKSVASGKKGTRTAGSSPPISKEKLLTMLKDMIGRLGSLKADLESKLPQRMAEAQGDFSAAREMLNVELMEGISAVEKEIQSAYGVSQMETLQAQQAHAEDPEVLEVMRQLTTVFYGEEAAVDPDDIEVPEGMTSDIFYEKFCKHINIVDRTFERAVEEVKASAPREDRLQYLQLTMMRQLQEVNSTAAQEIGLTEEEFHRCLAKYQADARFPRKIMESQERQGELRDSLDSD